MTEKEKMVAGLWYDAPITVPSNDLYKFDFISIQY